MNDTMNDAPLDAMHPVSEAARRWGVKKSTVRRWIYEKKVDVYRPGPRSVRISERTVRERLARGFSPAAQR
ncbi:MAG: helix-turn-helix domain-containing protein [Pyrinomonadaceae bacterium]|nr:helix-turn-helix domain-containing protein [Pyrinomonadaceae bacterium]